MRNRSNEQHPVGYAKKILNWQSAVLGIIVVIMFILIGIKTAVDYYTPIRQLLYSVLKDSLEWPLINSTTYYVVFLAIWAIPTIILTSILYSIICPKIVIRDKNYVLALFKDRSSRSPSPTREELKVNIFGGKRAPKELDKELSILIDDNVKPIKAFLDNKSNQGNTLCINSKWGTGKTTSLLIAINETKNLNYRYIYESTFKYNGNANEFINDLLMALNSTMTELGIKSKKATTSLIKNLDSDYRKTIINAIKHDFQVESLSADLILELNEQYDKLTEGHGVKTIFLIVDDLDRTQGEDVVRILSLLSILRNIKFVKLIIPADLRIIQKVLDEYKVVDSPQFIEKYLPVQNSIVVKSGFEMTKNILSSKIQTQNKEMRSQDAAKPTLAAIYIGMLANEMQSQTRNFAKIRYNWLDSGTYQEKPERPNEQLNQLLLAPITLYNVANAQSNDKYDWDSKFNNITKFQNIIYALRKAPSGTNMPIGINTLFCTDDYDIIEYWIFRYMEMRWDIFGFTIRAALDVLESVRYSNLPQDRADQFIYIFNQLFPEQQLWRDNRSKNKA